jgi:hypothetical protein
MGRFFRLDRDRGRVDCGSGVSSEPSVVVEEVNDPSDIRHTARESSTARNSLRPQIEILGGPEVIAAQVAASHIHAGSSRERPGRTSM